MSLFLITFFLIYSAFHAYAFYRTQKAFRFSGRARLLLAGFMAAMVAAPVTVRLLEREGFEALARLCSWIGYSWLGVLFLFIAAAAALDTLALLLFLSGRLPGLSSARRLLSPRLRFALPLAVALGGAGYGYFAALDIRTSHYQLASPKIPASLDQVRIVQLSDVHLGLIVRHARLARMIDLVKRADPDLLVSTGDLVDGQINGLAGLAEMLAALTPALGKFAVTGNHEFYAGLGQALDFTRQAGFTLLRGEVREVTGWLNLAGVDDPTAAAFGHAAGNERELLARLPSSGFTLLLKHRPLVDEESLGLFDLQLSGHTHKGQIFPFNLVTRLYYPLHAGWLQAARGSALFVSRGAGTWGPPFRLFSPPEVTVIDLVHGQGE